MLWFFGGYILAAIAFYSYITVTAKDEPDFSEQGANLTTSAPDYAYSSGTTGDAHGRKAA